MHGDTDDLLCTWKPLCEDIYDLPYTILMRSLRKGRFGEGTQGIEALKR
jgi:hypothetical protein